MISVGLFESPAANQKLWRYMDLSKFLSALQTRSLWFSRADFLGDPLEGSVPLPRYAAEEARRASGDDQLSEWRRSMLTSAYVSCWHANDGESAAMWSLYAKSDESICVQTTFGKLTSLLPPSFVGGMVRYIDYETEDLPSLNLFQALMHKRCSYAHEHEFRVIGWIRATGDGSDVARALAGDSGLAWPIDPNEYLERVHVSPTAPAWFRGVVERAMQDHQLNADVQQSSLIRSPLY